MKVIFKILQTIGAIFLAVVISVILQIVGFRFMWEQVIMMFLLFMFIYKSDTTFRKPKTNKILKVLSKETNKSKSEITEDAVKLFAFMYGKHNEGVNIYFEDKRLKFEDFINKK